MKPLTILAGACLGLAGCTSNAQTPLGTDTVPTLPEVPDSTRLEPDSAITVQSLQLTQQDYDEVAQELGVEVAALKAVVEIEAGKAHKGFTEPGMPLINFDLKMFRRFATRHKVSLAGHRSKHPVVFKRPNVSRYGSYQKAQHARLTAASEIDRKTAVYATFWGLFQIGGFNWQLCGCEHYEEFVTRMSTSEREQLELFAAMIRECGYLKHLQNKNWASFARGYNGPGYARHGYHRKMAAAYSRYKKEANMLPEA